jgi:hypothetical protein
MYNPGSWTFAAGLPGLALGLVVGLLGSYLDDLLGSGGLVTVLQVLVWVFAGLTIITSLAGLVVGSGQTARPGRPVHH